MNEELKLSFPVDSRMSDCFGMCRPSALLGFLQEAADEHSARLGCSRAELVQDYGVVWLMVRQWYRLDRPLFRGDTVTVQTWQRGIAGAVIYRDYDLLSDGERVGEAVSSWVLFDLKTHRPVRFSRVPLIAASPMGSRPKSVLLERLPPPEQPEHTERRTVRYSDCDINRHMNNVRYADVTCDAFHYETMEGRSVSSMQICYRAECRAGETLTLRVGQRNGRRIVSGSDEEGTIRFVSETGFFDGAEKQG